MAEVSKFSEYQNALAELLSSGKTHAEIMESLKSDPNFEHYREYIDQFDPDMVEVARELMGKWAQRVD